MLSQINPRILHSVAQSLSDAVVVVDFEGTILFWNKAAEVLFGYTEDEQIGHDLWPMIPERYRRAHEEEFRRVVATGQSRTVGRPIEIYACTKNGLEIPVELSITHWGTGNDMILVGTLRDISERKRQQNILLEVEKQYQFISQNAQDIISYINREGIFQYVSPAARNLLGYEPEELMGTRSMELYHPDDIEYIHQLTARIVAGDDVDRFTCRVHNKDGRYLWFETTIKVVRNERGEMVRVIGVGRDITAQKKMSEQLAHAVRIAGLGHWEWDVVNDRVKWSEQMHRIYGLTPGEVDAFTFAEVVSFVHSEDIERMEFAVKCALESKAPYDTEWRIIREDGAIRHLHAQGEVFFDNGGNPIRMIGTVQDVTDRRFAEQRLQESEARYRRIVDNSRDAVGIFEHGKWTFMNRAGLKFFGATSDDEIIGRNYSEFLHADHHEEYRKRVRAMMAGETVGIAEQKWIRLDGEVVHAEVTGIPFSETAVQVVIHDTTERKKTNEMLMQSEKLTAVGQLAAGVAHEIRNPLTALKGFTQLLRSSSEGQTRRYFDIMRGELDRIEMILSEMLILAKPQSVTFKPRPIGLILHEVITLLSTQAVMKNVVIESKLESEVLMINCEESQLKQVFVNVIKNALEAMPTGGKLFIHLRSTSNLVHIEFTDEGDGIPADKIPKLGEPFFTTKETGTGLGLMMSQKIVFAHQGTMDIASEVGRGTTVSIALPSLKEAGPLK